VLHQKTPDVKVCILCWQYTQVLESSTIFSVLQVYLLLAVSTGICLHAAALGLTTNFQSNLHFFLAKPVPLATEVLMLTFLFLPLPTPLHGKLLAVLMTGCINTISLSREKLVFANHILKDQSLRKIRGIAGEQRSTWGEIVLYTWS